MRRKESRKKKSEENFFDRNRIFGKYKRYRVLAMKFYFLSSLQHQRIKKLHKLNFNSHYIIFRNFMNDLKIKKGNLFYKILIKNKKFIITYPAYVVKKQFTELRVNTISFEKNYFDYSIPIFYKKLDFFKIKYDESNKYTGLNYYSYYNDRSLVEKFKDDILKDDFKKLIYIKYDDINSENPFFYAFHYHFNYNFFVLNSIEIYKSLIYLHLNKLIIKYI